MVSVIVTNYNYGRFLRAALDSALSQWPRPEVVVVDDGSTDNSRQVIASYGREVVPVLKDNGGQISATNAGLGLAGGDVIIFLDADDILLAGAIERVVDEFSDRNVVKVHWQMRVLAEDGTLGDELEPAEGVSDGELLDTLVRGGPGVINNPPTSGNAWSRRYLDAIFPLPLEIGPCGDAYMGALAPLYGRVVRVHEPLSAYRKHGESKFGAMPFDVRLRLQRTFHDRCCQALEHECRERGLPVDRKRWDEESWICPVQDLVDSVQRHVPPGQPFILIDDNQCDMDETGGRRAIQLIARDGIYWGAPEDDDAAIAALDAHVEEGIEFLALAPESRWWIDEYPRFFRHMSDRGEVVEDDGRLMLYRLRGTNPDSSRGSPRSIQAPP